MKLKNLNNNLKIMLAVGGWDVGSYPFNQIVADHNATNEFANNVVLFLKKWGFDGLGIFFKNCVFFVFLITILFQILIGSTLV